MFSGGVASWGAAKRVVARYGPADVTLLFADTLIEDEDLYRFLPEAAANVGVPLTTIADGRTPWEVFRDRRFLGNSRVDPCSAILKRDLMRKWLEDNCDPVATVAYLGLDWTELGRVRSSAHRWAPWPVAAPLCDRPIVTKQALAAELKEAGIAVPRLYRMGFPHNNCGGFCVKAGQGQFAMLLEVMPERYAWHEAKEEEARALLGDVSIMTDRAGGGKRRPLTMREFRERRQAGVACDLLDLGGCGCATDE